MTDTIIIIPARMGSSRFPGKMLAPIAGRPLIQHSCRAAMRTRGARAVYVATDSTRIADAARAAGAEVLMTDDRPRNGTERVAQALAQLPATPGLVINFQGDAPLTPPWFTEALIRAAEERPDMDMLTPVVRCTPRALAALRADRKAGRVGATTAVFDQAERALYFSKEILPHGATEKDDPPQVFHHVGLYAYRPEALKRYAALPEGRLERLEGLEQLRFLENGLKVGVVRVKTRGRSFWEVNNPEDTAMVEEIMAREGAP